MLQTTRFTVTVKFSQVLHRDPPNEEIHKLHILYNSTFLCNMQIIFTHPDCFQAMYNTECGAKVRPVTSMGFLVWVNSPLSARVGSQGVYPSNTDSLDTESEKQGLK